MVLFLLSESASGYGLMEVVEADDIASGLPEVQAAVVQFVRFSKMVKLRAFAPFTSAEYALENMNMISEGLASDYLKNFLTSNLPSAKKKDSQYSIGVHRDPKFKSSIAEVVGNGIEVLCDNRTEELLRGVRMHFERFIEALKPGDLHTSQLGLAHSYSRSKVKFNPHKSDNMVIQSIALLDQLDKDINTFAMRVREWYSWHFPELVQIVPDNILYSKLVKLIKNKKSLSSGSEAEDDTELVSRLNEIIMDEDKCHDVIEAARSSMGTDISPIDLINIESFASRVVSLAEYRASLHAYLSSKMHLVAPNLAALIGEQVGARLIAHAGSLTSLAKYPASTVQILGAEKALFRALKTKSKTPKYGLLFHSTFIGRARMKNKGRISRYLANKCSIASRVDCFGEGATDIFGIKLREQVEERLKFFDSGAAPRKNVDVMREAAEQARSEMQGGDDTEMRESVKANEEDEHVGDKEAGRDNLRTSGKKKKKKEKRVKKEKKEEREEKERKEKKVKTEKKEEREEKEIKEKKEKGGKRKKKKRRHEEMDAGDTPNSENKIERKKKRKKKLE